MRFVFARRMRFSSAARALQLQQALHTVTSQFDFWPLLSQ